MDVGADGAFQFPVRLPRLEPGFYYLQLFIRRDPEDIPYKTRIDGLEVPGEGTVCAAGLSQARPSLIAAPPPSLPLAAPPPPR